MTQLKLFALAVCCVTFQSLFMTLWEHRMSPDLVLILAMGMGLRGDRTWPLVLAFGLGFSIDVLSSSHGLYALLRGTACAMTYLADRALYLRSASPWALYVFAYAIVDSLLLGVVTQVLRPEVAPLWSDLLWPAPLGALLTAIVAAFVYPMLERLDSSGGYDVAWSSLRAKGRA